MTLDPEKVKKALEQKTSEDWFVDSGETLRVRNGSGTIATLHQVDLTGRRSAQEVKANAQLIAMAPDLAREWLEMREEVDGLRAVLGYLVPSVRNYITATKAWLEPASAALKGSDA